MTHHERDYWRRRTSPFRKIPTDAARRRFGLVLGVLSVVSIGVPFVFFGRHDAGDSIFRFSRGPSRGLGREETRRRHLHGLPNCEPERRKENATSAPPRNAFVAVEDDGDAGPAPATTRVRRSLFRPSSTRLRDADARGREAYVTARREECLLGSDPAADRYRRSSEARRTEVWKYCALLAEGGVYLDASSPLTTALEDFASFDAKRTNVAVLGFSEGRATVHGGLLALQTPGARTRVAQGMLRVLLLSEEEDVSAALHRMILEEMEEGAALVPGLNRGKGDEGETWLMLELDCRFVEPGLFYTLDSSPNTSLSFYEKCPTKKKRENYCCQIHHPCLSSSDSVVMITSRPVLPPLDDLPSHIPRPYHYEPTTDRDETPYQATVRETRFEKDAEPTRTPNFRDMLEVGDCLPSSKCVESLALVAKNGRSDPCDPSGDGFRLECRCYCAAVCGDVRVPDKFVAALYSIRRPLYMRDASRFVPRLIHQTWFEPPDEDVKKYPNFSRFVASWKIPAWQYNFYDDESSRDFLYKHFPSEVLESYDTLIPGAFKADLFRYCVLLIRGGVYADIDVLLESNLERSIEKDVGFLIPMDEIAPYCVWNGLMASSPSHPFLAKAIESVVNQVRNRFTSVDVDRRFCPDSRIEIVADAPDLHVAGPCLLGTSINLARGVHPQSEIPVGDDVDHPHKEGFGRFVLLRQHRRLMGAHRFVDEERNLLVASTDFSGSNDLEHLTLQKKDPKSAALAHYSTTLDGLGELLYGEANVYIDQNIAHEDIHVILEDALGRDESDAVEDS